MWESFFWEYEGLRRILTPIDHGFESGTKVVDARFMRFLNGGELVFTGFQFFLLGVQGVLG